MQRDKVEPRSRVRSSTASKTCTAALLPTIFLYATADSGFDAVIGVYCLAIFYIVAAHAIGRPVIVANDIKTFATIEIFFLIFFYLLFYFPYQTELLGISDLRVTSFVGGVTFWQQSNRALLLTTVALLAFKSGISRRHTRRDETSQHQRPPEIDRAHILIGLAAFMSIALMAIYIGLGWRSSGEGRYTASSSGGSAADGAALLIVMFIMINIAACGYLAAHKLRVPTVGKLALAVAAGWCLRLLSFGDRNSFLLIAVCAIAVVMSLRYQAGRVVLIALAFAGLILYNSVEAVRMTNDASLHGIWMAATGQIDVAAGTNSSDSSFNITTIGLRATFESVPSDGFGLGEYKILGFLGIVPMVRGVLIGSWSAQLETTTDLLSATVLGPNPSWTIGTNVISDIYLDFGIPGLIVLMWCLGRFAWHLTERASRLFSLDSVVLYFVALPLFAELPRYALDFPVRALFWTVLTLGLTRAIMELGRKSRREPALPVQSTTPS